MSRLISFLGLIVAIFLLIAMIFLKYGDSENRYWFALFKENQYIFIFGLLLVIRKMLKYIVTVYFIPDLPSKRVKSVINLLDGCIAYVSFYIIFHVAILLPPLKPYKDFTQNPAIIALFIWGFVVFLTIKILTNGKK